MALRALLATFGKNPALATEALPLAFESWGDKPETLARRKQTVDVLLEAGAAISGDALEQAIGRCDVALTRLFLEKGAKAKPGSDLARLGVEAAPWVLPLGPYPRRVRSDTVSGMNPGFDVVLLGLCAPEHSGSRLEALEAFYPGVYVKRVSAKAAQVGCPLVLEQPLAAANKSGKVGADTVSVSIQRRGRERSCVAVRVRAKGGLSSFAAQALEAGPSCSDFEEAVALDGCSVRCGGKTTRVKLKP